MCIRDRQKSFGDLHVLRGIDLNIQKGDVVAVLGSSGSGKTTLLRCMNFLEPVSYTHLDVYKRQLRATGANQNMARAQGINTNVTKVLGLMISNGLVALAGGLLAQYQGFSDINMGRGAIVIGLAAVIIGEVIFSRIFRNFALKLLSAVCLLYTSKTISIEESRKSWRRITTTPSTRCRPRLKCVLVCRKKSRKCWKTGSRTTSTSR